MKVRLTPHEISLIYEDDSSDTFFVPNHSIFNILQETMNEMVHLDFAVRFRKPNTQTHLWFIKDDYSASWFKLSINTILDMKEDKIQEIGKQAEHYTQKNKRATLYDFISYMMKKNKRHLYCMV